MYKGKQQDNNSKEFPFLLKVRVELNNSPQYLMEEPTEKQTTDNLAYKEAVLEVVFKPYLLQEDLSHLALLPQPPKQPIEVNRLNTHQLMYQANMVFKDLKPVKSVPRSMLQELQLRDTSTQVHLHLARNSLNQSSSRREASAKYQLSLLR